MTGITEYSMLDIYDYIDKVSASFSLLSFLEHHYIVASLYLHLKF